MGKSNPLTLKEKCLEVIELYIYSSTVKLYHKKLHYSFSTPPARFQYFPVKHIGKVKLSGGEKTITTWTQIKITASDKNQ